MNEWENERASKCRYSFTNDFNLELFENTASTPWHIHNCIELIYILEGNCIINTDHSSFASAGDVILIFNDVPHYTDCFENVSARRSLLEQMKSETADGFELAAISPVFMYTFEKKICVVKNERYIVSPSVSYGSIDAAYNGGIECALAIC